jgi:hypothetical protein
LLRRDDILVNGELQTIRVGGIIIVGDGPDSRKYLNANCWTSGFNGRYVSVEALTDPAAKKVELRFFVEAGPRSSATEEKLLIEVSFNDDGPN